MSAVMTIYSADVANVPSGSGSVVHLDRGHITRGRRFGFFCGERFYSADRCLVYLIADLERAGWVVDWYPRIHHRSLVYLAVSTDFQPPDDGRSRCIWDSSQWPTHTSTYRDPLLALSSAGSSLNTEEFSAFFYRSTFYVGYQGMVHYFSGFIADRESIVFQGGCQHTAFRLEPTDAR